jgi:hypothetical protein
VKPEEIPLLHKQLDGLVMLLLEEEITGDSTNEMGAGMCANKITVEYSS